MAGDSNEARPAKLRPTPAAVMLRGPDAVQQLAIDGLTGGEGAQPRDVTRGAHFVSSDAGGQR